MTRMTSLIRRPTPAHPASDWVERRREPEADPMDDVRLFATGWAGGMIFFATFFS